MEEGARQRMSFMYKATDGGGTRSKEEEYLVSGILEAKQNE